MIEFGPVINAGLHLTHPGASRERKAWNFEPPRRIEGIGIKFMRAHPWNGVIDIFMPGCAAKSIERKGDVRLSVDHDSSTTLATVADGTLELHSEDRGVTFRAQLSDTAAGAATFEGVQSGERASVSPGYKVTGAEFLEIDGYRVRAIREIDLVELSLCKVGAVPTTFAAIINGTDTNFTESFGAMELKGAYCEIKRSIAKLMHILEERAA